MIVKGEHGVVKVTTLFRNQSQENDFWDSNWITCTMDIKTPGFTASYNANLRTDEFMNFLNQVNKLRENQVNESIFGSVEDWLNISIERDSSSGKFQCSVLATAVDFNGSSLKFKMDMDNGHLDDLVASLTELLREYPVLFPPASAGL